jgi:hypothetical protein
MSAPIKQDAAFRWTENGQDHLHYLGAKIRRPTVNPVQQVHRWRSADLTTERVISIGAGVQDLSGTLRFDGSPDSLARFVAAGRRGASLEYLPSLSTPSLSFPCVLVEAGEITTDPDLWFDRRHQVDVRLRRIDGGSWRALLEESLFYWRAGNALPGMVFTRSGVIGAYVDSSGALQNEATPNVFRTDWVDTNGDGSVDTPTLLLEPAASNLLLQSADFGTTWSAGGATITTNTETAPNGLVEADNIEDTGAGVQGPLQDVTIPDDSASYVFGVFVHKTAHSGDIGQLQVTLQGGTPVGGSIRFDPTAGTVAAHPSSTPDDFGIEDHSADWWLVWVVRANNSSGNTTARCELIPAAAATLGGATDSAQTGDATFWGAQLAVGTSPSGHIPTTTVAVTRGAEKMSAPPGFTMEDIRAAGGATFYTSWIERGTAWDVTSSTRYWQVGNAVRLLLFADDAGDGTIDGQLRQVGGGLANSAPSAVVPLGSPAEARLVVFLDDDDDWKVQLGVSVNGAAEVLGSVATFGATLPDFDVDLLTFGAGYNQSVQAPVGLRTIKGIGGVRTMAEMRLL